MNKSGNDQDEREWQAQERALREARSGRRLPSDDVVLARYQAIAEVLGQSPQHALPADFAGRVARIAAQRTNMQSPQPAGEQVLVRVLACAFALSAAVAFGAYGARLLAMLQAATGGDGLKWMLLLAGCMGLSWSLDRLRQRWWDDGGDGPMRAGAAGSAPR